MVEAKQKKSYQPWSENLHSQCLHGCFKDFQRRKRARTSDLSPAEKEKSLGASETLVCGRNSLETQSVVSLARIAINSVIGTFRAYFSSLVALYIILGGWSNVFCCKLHEGVDCVVIFCRDVGARCNDQRYLRVNPLSNHFFAKFKRPHES